MSARPQQTGRAAEVRRVLSMFPQGATVEQIKTAGRINSTHQAIGYTLKGLARSGQAICHRSGVRGIWRLSSHTQHAIAPCARHLPGCSRPARQVRLQASVTRRPRSDTGNSTGSSWPTTWTLSSQRAGRSRFWGTPHFAR